MTRDSAEAGRLQDVDVDWNFRFDEGEIVKWEYAASNDEWPYWTIERRMFDPDEFERVYHIKWMHPATWEIKTDVISESDCFARVEHADEDAAEQLAERLVEQTRQEQ